MGAVDLKSVKVGFIGLGRMGSGMAGNLAASGIDLTVFDPIPATMEALVEKGAKAASSVAELAAGSDVIFTSLPGPVQVEEVVLGDDGIELAAGGVFFSFQGSFFRFKF